MKKLVKFICLLMSIAICSSLPQTAMAKTSTSSDDSDSVWPTGPKASSLSAESAVVIDASTGLVLYNKKMNEQHYPASITKIMTTLLCLENSSLDEVVTFSKEAVYGIEANSSHIAIDVGEQLTMKDTLYAIMLESANEACLGAAEHVAGSIDAFVDMMNEKAEELGCKNTHFANPNGLHNDNHYTTAYDMALISQAALQNETFRTITSTKTYTIPATNKKEARDWIKNHHQMLNGYKYPQYEYDYCIGGKTGYTTVAGNTLVTFAEKDGMTLICVVMKADSPSLTPNEYTDTTTLLDWAFDNYTSYSLTSTSDDTSSSDTVSLFTKYSALLNTDNPLIYMSDNANVILPDGVDIDDTTQEITYNDLDTYEEGENVIGTVTYTYDGKTVGSGDIIYNNVESDSLVTETKVSQNKSSKALNKSPFLTWQNLCIVVAAVLIILFLIYYFFIVRKKRKENSYYGRRRKVRRNRKY